MSTPSVSIAVLGFAGDPRREETLRSLATAGSALEVIDASHEPGTSPAAALNRAFGQAGGAIFGYLQPGEALASGAIARIVALLAPETGRAAAIGRAGYLVSPDDDVLVDHPREYLGHFEHLAVWKRGIDTVPRASLFWRRSAWEALQDAPACAIDYELVCALGERHAIDVVDELWSVVPVPAGTDGLPSEAERLAILIEVSRRHWGSWLRPLRWRCALSHWLHERHLHERARHHARRAEALAAEGRRLRATVEAATTWVLSPGMARGRWRGLRLPQNRSHAQTPE